MTSCPCPHPVRRRRGATLLEVMFVILIMAIVSGFLFRTVRVRRVAYDTVDRLEALSRLRLAEARLRNELEMGTAILYPPPAMAGGGVSQAVFANRTNDLLVLYVTPEGVMRLQCSQGNPRTLADRVIDFSVSQPLEGYVVVEFSLEADDDEDTDRVVDTSVSMVLMNSYLGVGRPPSGLP